MKCPKCNSERNVRNGIIRGLQRYKCKDCHASYTASRKATAVVDKQLKRQALIMYLQGLSIVNIAQTINVSHVSVRRWIKRYSNNLAEVINDQNMPSDLDISPEDKIEPGT